MATPAQRFVLSARAAAAVSRLIAPNSTYGSRARPAKSAPDAIQPLPFDCRIAYGADSALPHLYVFAPRSVRDTAMVRIPVAPPNTKAVAMLPALDDGNGGDWIDAGEIARGDSYAVVIVVAAADSQAHGNAAPVLDTAYWAISRNGAIPPGYVDAGPLGAGFPLCVFGASGPLRQLRRGCYFPQGINADTDTTGSGYGTGNPETASIEINGGARLSLFGFADPHGIANPYAGDTPPDNADDYLLPLRVVVDSQSGRAILLYLQLASLAPAATVDDLETRVGNMEDDADGRTALPCPADGNGAIVFYDPCARSWQSTATADGAAILKKQLARLGGFWALGGTESTAYGSAIGNAIAAKVIDLDARKLEGAWTAADNLTVAGVLSAPNQIQAPAGINAAGNVALTNGATITGANLDASAVGVSAASATIGAGGINSSGPIAAAGITVQGATITNGAASSVLSPQRIESGGTLAGADLEISGNSITINGTTYAPRNITIDGVSFAVLAT